MPPSPESRKAPTQELESGVGLECLNCFESLIGTTGRPKRVFRKAQLPPISRCVSMSTSPAQETTCFPVRLSRLASVIDTTGRTKRVFRNTPPPPTSRVVSTHVNPAQDDTCSSERLCECIDRLLARELQVGAGHARCGLGLRQSFLSVTWDTQDEVFTIPARTRHRRRRHDTAAVDDKGLGGGGQRVSCAAVHAPERLAFCKS